MGAGKLPGEESTKLPCVKLRLIFIKDRNLLVQDRVNKHLLMCRPSLPEPKRRLIMDPQNERSPHSQLQAPYGPHGMSSAVDSPTTPTASDRLYQFAALTAGIFLLATLL